MANYRTNRKLLPYMGCEITRTHKDGAWYYRGVCDDGTIINERSLADMKKSVRRHRKEQR